MKKILLVNSIQALLEEEKTLLDRADFTLYTASSGKEALDIHREQRIDLIVAEIDMSDMNGDELCSHIRKELDLRSASVILVCTDTPDDLERVSKCGANAWIIKPFRADQLLRKIEQALAISTRRGYRVLLRVKAHGTEDNVVFFCISHNISVSGILIETEKFLNRGARINCAFYLPGSCQVSVDGEVVRSVLGPDGINNYGVRFIDLPQKSREEIEKFVATS
ncbi:MAG TPA: response regulator, partial [Spirochaetota bacterium]